MSKPKIINLSFKDNLDDNILLSWLEDKFEEYGSKSNYIKYVLRQKMREELEEREKSDN